MDLKALNEISLLEKENKPIKKLRDLEQDIKYLIVDAKVTNSKFGEVILLELEDYVTFLPKRVTESYSLYVKYFKEKKYSLIFRGTKDCKKAQEASLFEIVE